MLSVQVQLLLLRVLGGSTPPAQRQPNALTEDKDHGNLTFTEVLKEARMFSWSSVEFLALLLYHNSGTLLQRQGPSHSKYEAVYRLLHIDSFLDLGV